MTTTPITAALAAEIDAAATTVSEPPFPESAYSGGVDVTAPSGKKIRDAAIAPLVALARGYRSYSAGDTHFEGGGKWTVADKKREILDRYSIDGRSKYAKMLAATFADGGLLEMPWFDGATVKASVLSGKRATPTAAQVRPDVCPKRTEGKRAAKYVQITPRLPIDLHPATPASWLNGEGRYTGVIVVEGLLKADSALTAMLRDALPDADDELAAACRPGTDARDRLTALMERVPFEKRWLVLGVGSVTLWGNRSAWDAFTFEGATVWLGFDGDVVSKRPVNDQARRCWDMLSTKSAASTGIVLMPEGDYGNGIDDWLAFGGGSWAALVDLVADEVPPRPPYLDQTTVVTQEQLDWMMTATEDRVLGAALRFAVLSEDNVRWIAGASDLAPEKGHWRYWNGQWWEHSRADMNPARDILNRVADALEYDEGPARAQEAALACEDPEGAKACYRETMVRYRDWASWSRTTAALREVVPQILALSRYADDLPEGVKADLSVPRDDWDNQPHLRTIPTVGTVDLTTGLMREPRREDLITAPLWAPSVLDPQWGAWHSIITEGLEAIAAGKTPEYPVEWTEMFDRFNRSDPNTVSRCKAQLGLALWGASEETIIAWYSPEATGVGKSTWAKAVAAALGTTLAPTGLPFSMLTRRTSSDAPSPNWAKCADAALVLFDDGPSADERMDVSATMLKDKASPGAHDDSRGMYSGSVYALIRYSMFMITNQPPSIPGADTAVRRRFSITWFSPDSAISAGTLDSSKAAQYTTVTGRAWALLTALEGCVASRREQARRRAAQRALGLPDAVSLRSVMPEQADAAGHYAEFFSITNPLQGFLDATYEVVEDESAEPLSGGDIYSDYKRWYASVNADPSGDGSRLAPGTPAMMKEQTVLRYVAAAEGVRRHNASYVINGKRHRTKGYTGLRRVTMSDVLKREADLRRVMATERVIEKADRAGAKYEQAVRDAEKGGVRVGDGFVRGPRDLVAELIRTGDAYAALSDEAVEVAAVDPRRCTEGCDYCDGRCIHVTGKRHDTHLCIDHRPEQPLMINGHAYYYSHYRGADLTKKASPSRDALD